MITFVPAIIVFLIQLYLLVSWLRHRPKSDGKAKRLCLWGFLLGQLYFLWEIVLVNQTGTPPPDSPEQQLAMTRFALGGTLGGLFTIIGLFYLSFAGQGRVKPPEEEEK